MKIEIGVPTKDRYEQLAMLLWSFCEQTHKDWDVTIVDDSENVRDIRELPFILPILKRMNLEGHQWRVKFGRKKGPHWSHQLVVDETRHPYIYRVDDDCILDRNALSDLVLAWEQLESSGTKVGAIGPIVLDPTFPPELKYLPLGFRSFKKYQGKIDECGINYGDHQWRMHPDSELQEVEHIYSSFLYSADVANKIGGYDLEYNVVGHREETDFTYRMFKNGYKLFIQPKSLVWHLRNPFGGIRTYDNASLWGECQERFMNKFNFKRGKNEDKVVRVFGGLGDHICSTPMLRGLEGKKVVSSIYPYLFQGLSYIDELLYSPDEAQYASVQFKDLYKWAFESGFEGKLSEAFCKLYGVKYDGDNLDYYIFPLERKWVNEQNLGEKYILISTTGGVPVVQYADTTLTGSAKPRTILKNWFDDRWESLVQMIKRELKVQVYQVGGANDIKIANCNRHYTGVDYRLSVALLEKSSGFISVDTFLQHAGHAIGRSGVVLFGPSVPEIFGHESHANVCHLESCDRNRSCLKGKELKFQWLSHDFDCDTRACMKAITVDEVFTQVKSLLEERQD